MRVEVRSFAMFRDAVGRKTVEREYDDGATVGDVLRDVERAYPELSGRLLTDDDLASAVTVLRNGRNVANLDGVETPLSDGDTVGISPPVTGG